MILRMAAGTMFGAVMVAGAVTTLALGAGAVGSVLLARRLCEERKGWQDGAKAEAEPEIGMPEAGVPDPV
ncbi:hypothetical protein HB662_21880 [Roseomonas frigidaquae]|uniref:Uncharacterized protein n=1 Tax=Falsiroseomonas frigidaquae TaxID=487318 RepID=A0ABX1F537_9PROT|nr:hypothetical protein [Falsiroseomonas frigidaquae]NKE47443.1 hypothetical protein [Falsiroseomonas frigidaquae]